MAGRGRAGTDPFAEQLSAPIDVIARTAERVAKIRNPVKDMLPYSDAIVWDKNIADICALREIATGAALAEGYFDPE